jgi:sterol desaturase/sphingolipid hydroxylase (fatty acid hydroxylase superfamily)
MYDILEWATLALIPLFMAGDLVFRARHFAKPRFWRLRATLVTVLTVGIATFVALAWATILGPLHVFDLSGLGVGWGAVVGILVYELLHYWYHRAAHHFDWLWRNAHQMHHSAESLDAFGANWLHPLDTIMFATLSSVVFFPLLGLGAEAGVIGALFLTFNAMFQHANIRTPKWLGYFIQRPESHGVHHARGVHRYNYSDLPLWDILFGTFRNPRHFESECGFWVGASSQIGPMLLARDVSTPEDAPLFAESPRPAAADSDTFTLFDSAYRS